MSGTRGTVEARFWSRIVTVEDCWVWTGAQMGKGYGTLWDGTKTVRAHRFSYELLRGPIPEGLTLDHACRNRLCVKPDHLRPMTNKENILIGMSPTAIHARKTHCIRGHLLTGTRECVPCKRIRDHNRHLRRMARKAAIRSLTPDTEGKA